MSLDCITVAGSSDECCATGILRAAAHARCLFQPWLPLLKGRLRRIALSIPEKAIRNILADMVPGMEAVYQNDGGHTPIIFFRIRCGLTMFTMGVVALHRVGYWVRLFRRQRSWQQNAFATSAVPIPCAQLRALNKISSTMCQGCVSCPGRRPQIRPVCRPGAPHTGRATSPAGPQPLASDILRRTACAHRASNQTPDAF